MTCKERNTGEHRELQAEDGQQGLDKSTPTKQLLSSNMLSLLSKQETPTHTQIRIPAQHTIYDDAPALVHLR